MNDTKTAEIGPVQLLAVGFGPDAKFEGKVLQELGKLERQETIRILDLLFVMHDAETKELVALDYQGEELGAIIGALLGFDFEGDTPKANSVPADNHAFGLSERDIKAMAARLEPGHAAAILLLEHVWARDLKRALREAGGVPLGEGFLTPEAIATVVAELVAMSEAVEEVEKEEQAAGTAA
jgi:uncharacterized membrane protein